MSKRKTQGRLLGKLATEVVGLQYHEAQVGLGRVNLEREPDNTHDPNAVRVETTDFDPVGHLPRREAAYLAPLIDAGKIALEGTVTGEAGETRAPVELEVFLAAKGEEIAVPPEAPRTAAEYVHRIVAEAFRDIEELEPGAAAQLEHELGALLRGDVWPETRLLLALLRWKAGQGRRKAAGDAAGIVRSVLEGLKIGEPLVHRNMAVFPLFGGNGPGLDYLLLDDALKAGAVEVTEVGAGGSVPELRLVNKGDRRVLLLDGDQLIGAKQNRIVNITILVGAKQTLVVPVSCVEQGRWSAVSREFSAGHKVSPSLRSVQCCSIKRSVRAGAGVVADQAAVWDKVSDELDALGAASPTEALSEGYESIGEILEAYRKALRCPKEAKGVIVAVNGQVAGLELFDKLSTLRRAWGKLIDAYATEAVWSSREKKAVKAVSKSVAEQFLASVLSSIRAARPAPLGEGDHVDIEGDKLVGTALVAEQQVVHLAAFRRVEIRDSRPGPIE